MEKVLSLILALGVLFSAVACTPPGFESTTENRDDVTVLTVFNFDGGVGTTWLEELKPLFEAQYAGTSFEDGKMGVVKKYRGNYAKCLATYVKERLSDRDDLTREILFVTHTKVDEDCEKAVAEAVSAYGNFETVYNTVAGCTVSCHCGPGTLGVLFVRK